MVKKWVSFVNELAHFCSTFERLYYSEILKTKIAIEEFVPEKSNYHIKFSVRKMITYSRLFAIIF